MTSPDRSAHHTIAGYVYQFDKTIVELLQAGPGTTVTVEGIEDIDLSTDHEKTAIQCKYYSSQDFSLARLRPAIKAMLLDSPTHLNRQYVIYVHCKAYQNFAGRLNLPALKRSLTEHHTSTGTTTLHFEGIPDHDLENFANRLTIQKAVDHQAQVAEILDLLQRNVDGTKEDCQDLFHPAARDAVLELAIKPNFIDRQLTKEQFIAKVNSKKRLYTRWHREVIGEEKYVSVLKRQIRVRRALNSNKRRFLIVDAEKMMLDELALLERISLEHPSSRAVVGAKPWTVLVEGSTAQAISLKRALLARGVLFVDGFEEVAFSPRIFDVEPVVNTVQGSQRIERVSHGLRVLHVENFLVHQSGLARPDYIFTTTTQVISGYEDRTFHLTNLDPSRVLEIMGC